MKEAFKNECKSPLTPNEVKTKLVKHLWAVYCEGGSFDSGDLFDLFDRAGMLKEEVYDPKVHEDYGFEGDEGDPIYFLKDEYK